MKILLLSAYDTPSHQYWREGIVNTFCEYSFTVLTLPPRFFSWRIRGSALSWSYENHKELNKKYDLIIATSMLDLAALKGLNSHLAQVPCVLYFHENQFEYPLSSDQHRQIDAQMVTLYSALAADEICFNSKFNRDSYLNGAAALIKKLPDHIPKNLTDLVLAKSRVLPVPLTCGSTTQSNIASKNNYHKACKPINEPLKIIWNHRWEYDKAPDRLLKLIQTLPAKLSLSFFILGKKFRSSPQEIQSACLLLKERGWLAHSGFIENKNDYYAVLSNADVVLSTAIHDFQGLSILEAVALGCIPVLPKRLAYPEFFDDAFLYASYLDDTKHEAQSAAQMIASLYIQKQSDTLKRAPCVQQLFWPSLKSEYECLFTQCGDLK